MKYGFVRVGAAVPKLKVANCEYNCSQIIDLIKKADKEHVKFLVFPELCITAYSCGDLFHQEILLKEASKQLKNILENTKDTDLVAIVGIPLSFNNQLFNCAVVIQAGRILGAVPKTFIPNYSEFYEERWFATGNKALADTINICGHNSPFGIDLLFESRRSSELCFGIEICEDLWVPIPPSSYQCMNGATLIFNPKQRPRT
jgi:NAD+ synthase (glutamine-hydrolysing)